MANVIQGTSATEMLGGSDENDIIYTNGGADLVWGFGGNDTLVQRGGSATLNGGTGNDVYVIFDGTISISELQGGGIDTLRTYVTMSADLADGVENIENIFYGGALTLRGNGLDNRIICGAASDTAYGRGGNDYILGSQYNASAVHGEDGNDILIGGPRPGGGDYLDGGSGNDILEGRQGPDSLRGGPGNDTYILLNDTSDAITETSGVDTITSTSSRNLGIAAYIAIENLTLLGTSAINGTGNGSANTITGNIANNVLSGGGGIDILIGGRGRDIMTGGTENDIFRYNSVLDSRGTTMDTITDFDDPGGGDDRIDLRGIYGPVLAYIHAAAFTGAGQVRINDIAGADVIVEVNTGGSLAADFAIRLTGTTLASMSAGDFLL